MKVKMSPNAKFENITEKRKENKITKSEWEGEKGKERKRKKKEKALLDFLLEAFFIEYSFLTSIKIKISLC